MAKATKQKQSIKDAAKEAYLKKHTKEQMYKAYDDLHAKYYKTNDQLEERSADLHHTKELKVKYAVKCNKLTLENVSLTMALNEQKQINKTYQWAIGIIIAISTIFLYFK